MWSAPPVDAADLAILRFIAEHRVDWLTSIARGIGLVGTSTAGLVAMAIAGGVLVVALRAWRQALAVFAAVVLAKEVVGLLKDLLERRRPPIDLTELAGGGFAFPSTHAAFTAAGVAACLAVMGTTRGRPATVLRCALVALVAAVGGCMVYLGSHWASDVLVGWAIGAPLGWVIGRVLRPSTAGVRPENAREPRAANSGLRGYGRGGGGGI